MNIAAFSPFAFSPLEIHQTITLPPRRPRDGARTVQRREFSVGAYRMRGGRLTEVLLGVKTRRGLRYVGSARPVVTELRSRLFQVLRMLRVHTFCPFPDLVCAVPGQRGVLPEHEVAESQWVEPNVKVWVEFDGWTDEGHLINPRVTGMK